MPFATLASTTPFQNLIQRNTNLLMRFWTSPDVLNESRAAIESLTRQAQASALNLFQSTAFFDLSRELFASYSQFAAESMKAQLDSTLQAQRHTMEEVSRTQDAALRRAA